MRALVVDDSKVMRTILGRMLRELGFEVDEAGDGEQALARLADERPAVMLVDWNMPVMNGLDLVRAVRARPELSELRVMMVTTESEAHQMLVALEAGANEYLMKPFTKEAVEEKLTMLGLCGADA